MNLASGLAVYFVIWWIVLFVTLPFGVRSQIEEGEIVNGTEPGAPALPHLLRKALITTILAAIIFALVWYLWTVYDF